MEEVLKYFLSDLVKHFMGHVNCVYVIERENKLAKIIANGKKKTNSDNAVYMRKKNRKVSKRDIFHFLQIEILSAILHLSPTTIFKNEGNSMSI